MRYKGLWVLLFIGVIVGCTGARDPQSLDLYLNPGVDTIDIGTLYNDPGAQATLGGVNHPVDVVENTVDVSRVGTYLIVYQTQSRDVTLRVMRFVDVVDRTPPQMTLNPGVDTVIINTAWQDAGVTVTDHSGLDGDVSVDGEVVISMAGEYRITYVSTDIFGNRAEIVRFVHVIDPK